MDGIVIGGSENGSVINVGSDSSIGMPEQKNTPYEAFSTGSKMRRGAQSNIFDNNGGTNKGSDGGVINKNGEYGTLTYGF